MTKRPLTAQASTKIRLTINWAHVAKVLQVRREQAFGEGIRQ